LFTVNLKNMECIYLNQYPGYDDKRTTKNTKKRQQTHKNHKLYILTFAPIPKSPFGTSSGCYWQDKMPWLNFSDFNFIDNVNLLCHIQYCIGKQIHITKVVMAWLHVIGVFSCCCKYWNIYKSLDFIQISQPMPYLKFVYSQFKKHGMYLFKSIPRIWWQKVFNKTKKINMKLVQCNNISVK
jgi:hypothetical protein